MAIARWYVKDKNPEGASIFGVPLADVSQEEWETYPKHVQDSVDASEMYRKTKPETAQRARPAEPADKET